jgi:hypothetical protein
MDWCQDVCIDSSTPSGYFAIIISVCILPFYTCVGVLNVYAVCKYLISLSLGIAG